MAKLVIRKDGKKITTRVCDWCNKEVPRFKGYIKIHLQLPGGERYDLCDKCVGMIRETRMVR